MPTLTVTSDDTLTLNNHVFVDQAFGDVSRVTFPNELLNRKTGKNGNSAFAANASGFNADLELRLLRGSADDQFMQNLVLTPQSSLPQQVFLSGTFVKSLGNGQGDLRHDTYTLSGGMISKVPDARENVEGDTEQAVVSYMVKFANASRVIA